MLDAESFGVACVVGWNIWFFRNGRLHGSDAGERDSFVDRSKNFLDSFKSARISFLISSTPHVAAEWQCPRAPSVKINFDAAVYETGDYQVAAVTRNPDCECLRWRIQKLHGMPYPVVAQEMGWSYIHLERDCLQVMNTFKDRSEDCLQSHGFVVSACFPIISSFSSFQVSFIHRVGNCLAHALAHFHLSEVGTLDNFVIPAELAI